MGLNLRMHRKLSTKMGTKYWSDAGKGVYCQTMCEAPPRRLNQSPIGTDPCLMLSLTITPLPWLREHEQLLSGERSCKNSDSIFQSLLARDHCKNRAHVVGKLKPFTWKNFPMDNGFSEGIE